MISRYPLKLLKFTVFSKQCNRSTCWPTHLKVAKSPGKYLLKLPLPIPTDAAPDRCQCRCRCRCQGLCQVPTQAAAAVDNPIRGKGGAEVVEESNFALATTKSQEAWPAFALSNTLIQAICLVVRVSKPFVWANNCVNCPFFFYRGHRASIRALIRPLFQWHSLSSIQYCNTEPTSLPGIAIHVSTWHVVVSQSMNNTCNTHYRYCNTWVHSVLEYRYW